ncbi:MAG TPA: DUF47 family protein [Opitutaceae bacterium]|jgi:hypothetical protein
MNLLRTLSGRNDTFFNLLEEGADEAKASVELFSKYLREVSQGGRTDNLDDFIQARRKEKRIRHLMMEELSKTFVTPLDREDLEGLSVALYRIPKQVERIVERLAIYPGRVPHEMFIRQAELMSQAAGALAFMVRQLRAGVTIEVIREANDRLQYAEGEADKVMLEQLKVLYGGDYDAKEFVILQKLFEMVEQAVDRCRNAGNIVVQVVLKHS